ncbi:MAG: transposase, partial [Anaerolineales bacterium]|nr:transposase [Anaerolineales bacterium]
QHLLSDDQLKEFVLQTLFEKARFLKWNLQAWAVLNNHYHFIAKSLEDSKTLSKLIQQLHSITAIQINKWDGTPGRQVWFNYWDSCLTYEKSYYARLHYVHINPVKHGVAMNAEDYPYCSYRWFLENGDSKLKEQVFNQPIDKINVKDDF